MPVGVPKAIRYAHIFDQHTYCAPQIDRLHRRGERKAYVAKRRVESCRDGILNSDMLRLA